MASSHWASRTLHRSKPSWARPRRWSTDGGAFKKWLDALWPSLGVSGRDEILGNVLSSFGSINERSQRDDGPMLRATLIQVADVASQFAASAQGLPTGLNVPRGASSARSGSIQSAALTLPFGELLLPFVLAPLADVKSATADVLSPAAVEDAFVADLAFLSFIGGRALFQEFERERPPWVTRLARISTGVVARPSRRYYDTFVSDRLNRFKELGTRYPGLFDLCCYVVARRGLFLRQLAARLRSDRPALAETLRFPGDGLIAHLVPNLSDRHAGGGQVCILVSASGDRVVYKPRSLAGEQCLSRCAALVAPNVTCPQVVDRGTHGWMAWAETSRAPADLTVAQVEAIGELCALAFLLRLDDCHAENVILGRRISVLDAETTGRPLTPLARSLQFGRDPLPGEGDLRDSVLESGLLPRWEIDLDGAVVPGQSPLTGSVAVRAHRYRWRAVNTDLMDYQLGIEKTTTAPAEVPLPSDSVRALSDGFERVVGASQRARAQLIETTISVPLSPRVLVRDTRVYDRILVSSLAPEMLANAEERSAFIVAALVACAGRSPEPQDMAVLMAEADALYRLDVPRFTVLPTGDVLEGERVIAVSEATGGSTLLERWIDAGAIERLQEQVTLAKFALGTFGSRKLVSEWSPSNASVPDSSDWRLTPSVAMTAVGRIATQLWASRRLTSDGQLYWLGPETYPNGRSRFGVLPPQLYGGTLGICLFLLAVDHVTRRATYTPRVLTTVRGLATSGCLDALLARDGMGMGGLGGMLYGISLIGELAQDAGLASALAEATIGLSETLRVRASSVATGVDVMGGLSGMILACLAARVRANGGPFDSLASDLAAVLGERIRARGQLDMAALNRPGLAHGPSGVALAMARVTALGRGQFSDAIAELLAAEDKAFDAEAGNWRDSTHGTGAVGRELYRASWCNGAPGIGLARADMNRLTPGSLPAVLHATVTCRSGGDSLCCGESGRAAILLRLGTQLGVEGAMQEGARKLYALAARERHAFFMDGDGHVSCPGLFNGAAGVGYTLLRYASQNVLPDIITFV